MLLYRKFVFNKEVCQFWFKKSQNRCECFYSMHARVETPLKRLLWRVQPKFYCSAHSKLLYRSATYTVFMIWWILVITFTTAEITILACCVPESNPVCKLHDSDARCSVRYYGRLAPVMTWYTRIGDVITPANQSLVETVKTNEVKASNNLMSKISVNVKAMSTRSELLICQTHFIKRFNNDDAVAPDYTYNWTSNHVPDVTGMITQITGRSFNVANYLS